jgi:hypothetical protein
MIVEYDASAMLDSRLNTKIITKEKQIKSRRLLIFIDILSKILLFAMLTPPLGGLCMSNNNRFNEYLSRNRLRIFRI